MKETIPVSRPMPLKQQPNVLPLEGEIDLHISPEVAESLRAMAAKKPKRIVVDLTRVTYLDSSGLAVLIRAMQDVQMYGGKLSLCGINADLRSIFEMARLDQVFLIDPRDDELLAAD